MNLSYDVVDVFTDRPYAGNPLAVVHGAGHLDTAALDTAAMQAIAAEFGLSETTFVLPPSGPADYRLRIFTPARELPFAGHPSVGSAWVLARAGLIPPGEVVQECGAGLLPVTVDAHGARVTGGAPIVGASLEGAALAAAVGLTPDDLDPAVPAGVAAAGVPYAFVVVRADAVARASAPTAAVLRSATSGADLTGLAVVALHGARAHLRMFAPEAGVVEDPATGSAAVALGVFLVDRGVLPNGPSELVIDQGAEIGRPSTLALGVEARDGAAIATSVGGSVAAVARGELLALPPRTSAPA